MAKTTRHTLAGAVVVALMLSLGGPAQAGSEDERSPTWALGNILHTLANALNGPEKNQDRIAAAASLQVTEASPVPAAGAQPQETPKPGGSATSR